MASAIKSIDIIGIDALILRELAAHPSEAIGTVARHVEASEPCIRSHLAALERFGFVIVDRANRPFTYAVACDKAIPGMTQTIGELIAWLM